MKNFYRALRDAFRFWPLLVLATLCSVGTGALWGINIGAMFPVIEVTIAGEPLQDWIRREIRTGEERVEDLNQQIAAIRDETEPIARRDKLKIEQLTAKIEAEQAAIASSQRLKPWIDTYLPRKPFHTVMLVVVLLMAGTVLKHIFQLSNTYLVALVAARIERSIRQKIFSKALSMDQKGFSGYGSSGFVAHITHSTEMLSAGITSVYGGAIREPLKLMSCLIGAGLICWRLLLLSLVVVPLVALLVVLLSRSLKKICRKMLQQAMGLHHVMLEALSNIRTVQAYTNEPVEQARFDRATLDMQRFSMRIVFLNALNRPITEILALGMMGTAILAGSYLVMNRATEIWGIQITDRPLTVASMLVFFGLLVGASDPVRKFSKVFDGINTGFVAAEQLYPLLDRCSSIKEPAEPESPPKPHRTLKFENVSFAYDGVNKVLHDVSLEVPFGSTVAIIGPNGAGKSSFINLVCRFFDPQQGCVRLDDVDLRKISLKDLRGRIGLVTQNTELFNETLLYNIRYGSEGATMEQVIEAAKLAHAHDFIMNDLPHKYETIIGQQGQRLSGGQRQRIALARAILRDPEILVLDEATSQIDVESERLIYETIRQTCGNRTVIFITHRHTMLEIADTLIKFDRGEIHVERQPGLRAA